MVFLRYCLPVVYSALNRDGTDVLGFERGRLPHPPTGEGFVLPLSKPQPELKRPGRIGGSGLHKVRSLC